MSADPCSDYASRKHWAGRRNAYVFGHGMFDRPQPWRTDIPRLAHDMICFMDIHMVAGRWTQAARIICRLENQ